MDGGRGKARDQEFHDFVSARRAGLVRTATLLTGGDAHTAEDLVQTTLTRLYVAWPSFRAARNPDGYLRRSLVNCLVDEHRRPWRRVERSTAVPPDLEAPVAEDEPDAAGEVRRALRELPPRMRAAVVFRYFYQLDIAETADALGCTTGTVKSQTARGLDRLRAALDRSVTGAVI